MVTHRVGPIWRSSAIAALAWAIMGTGQASAAVWQWGCMGALGEHRIAFNRERLIVVSGKGSAGKLDDFVRSDAFVPGKNGVARSLQVSATYQPEDANGGFAKSMVPEVME